MNAELIAGRSLCPEIIAAESRVKDALNKAAAALGIPAPSLTVTPDNALGPREFRIAMAGKCSTASKHNGLPAGAILIRSTPLSVNAQIRGGSADKFDVRRWPDPVQPGRTASIVYDMPPDLVPEKFRGSALTAVETVALMVARWLRRAAIDGFDQVSAAQVLAQLPAYDAAALLRVCGIDMVTALLVTLLRDSVPLGEFASVAPLLADEKRVKWTELGTVTAAFPGHLLIAAPRPRGDAERRRVIARAITVPRALRRWAGGESLQVWALDEGRGWMLPAQARPEEVKRFNSQLIEQAAPAASVDGAVLLTSPMRRADIAERLRPHYPDLLVVASHELPRGVPVQQRGSVRIAAPT